MERSYSTEEMEAIVRRALERRGPDDGVTHDELLAAAAEVGIAPDEVEAAALEVELEQDRRRWERSAQARRRTRLWARATAFAVLNGVLFAIDALTGAGWWVQWVLLGTGIPLGIQALRLFRPVGEAEVERERRREERLERRRARALRRRRRQGRGRGADDFEVVVERGVDLLLDAIASRAAKPRAAGPRIRVDEPPAPDADRGHDERASSEPPARRSGSRDDPGR